MVVREIITRTDEVASGIDNTYNTELNYLYGRCYYCYYLNNAYDNPYSYFAYS